MTFFAFQADFVLASWLTHAGQSYTANAVRYCLHAAGLCTLIVGRYFSDDDTPKVLATQYIDPCPVAVPCVILARCESSCMACGLLGQQLIK